LYSTFSIECWPFASLYVCVYSPSLQVFVIPCYHQNSRSDFAKHPLFQQTELTWRTNANTDFPANAANLREKLKFVDEVRSEAALRETTLKQKIAACHNKKNHRTRTQSWRPRPPSESEGL